MNLSDFIDQWKQRTFLQIFTIYLRYLIGGAFIIAAFGMGKVTGTSNLLNSMSHPIEKLEPIQQFFRVMIDSGLYWKFIGWTQIIAGILLMSQRFAKLGALIFFGLISNIFVITISYDFNGTPLVTGLMLLATLYLLVWDYRSFLVLIRDEVSIKRMQLQVIGKPYWMWLGIIMIASVTMLALLKTNIFIQLGACFAEGLLGFILFFFRNIENKETSSRHKE
jgi:uncharacterized membrane protein YphA (DoxX/SURF4 family)